MIQLAQRVSLERGIKGTRALSNNHMLTSAQLILELSIVVQNVSRFLWKEHFNSLTPKKMFIVKFKKVFSFVSAVKASK